MPKKLISLFFVFFISVIITLFGTIAHATSLIAPEITPTKPPLSTPPPPASFLDIDLISHIGGRATRIFAQGDYGYLGTGPDIVILELDTPTHPVQIGQLTLPGLVRDIFVVGDYAYVLADDNFLVIDVATPSEPVLIGSLAVGGLHLTIAGNYAYIAVSGSGMYILDIATPEHPTEVGFYAAPRIYDIAVANGYAYIANEYDMRVVNIANPASPVEVANFQLYGFARTIAAHGNFVYVGCSGLGSATYILDVSTPSAPIETGRFEDALQGVSDIAATDNYIYIVGVWDMLVVEVSNPAAPTKSGFYKISGGGTISIAGNYAYTTAGDESLQVLDISDSTMPAKVGSFDIPGNAETLAIQNHIAYINDKTSLHLVDFSTPTRPEALGVYQYLDYNYFKNVTVSGNYAYLSGEKRLQIVDISDPLHPTKEGSFTSAPWGTPTDVAIVDNFAYLISDSQNEIGLWVLDITNPTIPKVVMTSTIGGHDILYQPPYVYVGSFSGFYILDASTPAKPSIINFYPTGSSVFGIDVANYYAYLASGYNGLIVFDVSDSANARQVSVYDSPGWAKDVAVVPPYLYLADSSNGLRILDISNPAKLKDIGYYIDTKPVSDVAVAGDYIYTTNTYQGVFVLKYNRAAIEGKVNDVTGAGVAGVTISATTGLTVSTNTDGLYAFTDLLTGTYVLTPTLNAYTFWPLTQSISLASDVVGRNFTILAAPVSTTLSLNGGSMSLPAHLTYTDTQGLPIDLDFPYGIVTQPVTLVLSPILTNNTSDLAFARHGFSLSAYRQGSAQIPLQFRLPVTVTLHYTTADIKLVEDEMKLTLRLWQNRQWQDAAQTCNPMSLYARRPADKILSLPICQTGQFALFGPTNTIYLPLIFNDG